MQDAELAVSHMNKLTYEQLTSEIEALAAQLRPLLSNMEENWPEFDRICAQLRGYAFNAFSLGHQLYRKQSFAREKQKIKPVIQSISLEDLDL